MLVNLSILIASVLTIKWSNIIIILIFKETSISFHLAQIWS